MDILEKLRIIRENKNMSRKDVATHLHVSNSLINEIESGRTRLSLEIFLQLCQVYETNPIELIKNDNSHYILLEKKDIDELNRIISKINKQAIISDNNSNNN